MPQFLACMLGPACTLSREFGGQIDPQNVLINLRCHGCLLLCTGRYLQALLGDLVNRVQDDLQPLLNLNRVGHIASGLRPTFIHRLHGSVCTCLQMVDHLFDLPTRILRTPCQVAHFIRHYDETRFVPIGMQRLLLLQSFLAQRLQTCCSCTDLRRPLCLVKVMQRFQ